MARRLRLLAAAPFFLLAACKPDFRSPQERGRAAYAGFGCSRCHAIGAQGETIGPDLTFVGFRKTPAFLDVWLKDPRGWQESTKMPSFNFTEQTRANIVAYLSELKGEAFAGAKPWDGVQGTLQRGAVLYEKLGCGTCHGKGGAGGFKNNNVPGGAIPALRETTHTYTSEELAAKIKHGAPKPQRADPAGPEPMLAMPAWGTVLTDAEIRDLVSYLRTFKPTDDAGF